MVDRIEKLEQMVGRLAMENWVLRKALESVLGREKRELLAHNRGLIQTTQRSADR